jgi:hypothetical protein
MSARPISKGLDLTLTCFVRVNSQQNPIVQEYILPDFSSRQMGRVRRAGEEIGQQEQVLRMGNERFLVPEILFRPDDIGKESYWYSSPPSSLLKL